ncbi:MAG: hypothetical protein ACRDUV_19110 [Pseudonocardiaceae bacterium]
MKLSGPDFFEWMGLRRVRRGGLARWEGHYYDHGNPVPGWLIPDIVDGLLKDGLLELGDPDESGMRRVTLTEAGLTHYRVLCKRQRRKDLVAPPPEHGRTTETTGTPAGRRLSRKRSPDCRFRPEAPGGRSAFASGLAQS